jgi:predicted negative regulator of RcsB-dependent stress response
MNKCYKPSDEKYQFVIFVLLFILGTLIYIGYNTYNSSNFNITVKNTKVKN